MRYAYHDLGRQRRGRTVVVRWRGAAADVLLLDPVNFTKYREGRKPVRYCAGGRFGHSPARLDVPLDGHWYVVADLHGFGGHSRATVEVLDSEETRERGLDEEAQLSSLDEEAQPSSDPADGVAVPASLAG